MNTQSEFGHWVSGIRYQVSGIGHRGLVYWLIFFFCGFSLTGTGKERKYSFKEGEVIEYSLTEKQRNLQGKLSEYAATTKYRFIVNQVEKDRFHLTMKLVSQVVAGTSISETEQTVGISPELRSNSSSPLISSIFDAELTLPITFVLDSKGNILDLQGDKAIRDTIFKTIERHPEIKKDVNYAWIGLQFGIQKYRYLIHEFFPTIPEAFVDTLSIESGKNRVSRINTWPVRSIFPGLSDTVLLKRAYSFRNGDIVSVGSTAKDTIADMIIYWPNSSGNPQTINYQGYLPTYVYAYYPQENDLPKLMYGQVEIINTYHGVSKSNSVNIMGSLSNIGNRALLAHLPGSGFTRNSVPIKPDPQGRFTLDFDLDIPSGLIVLEQSPMDTNYIRIYVKPGDSVSFTADLNNLKTIEFRGAHSPEQKFLNQLLSASVPGDPVKSIQNVRKNMQYLAQQRLNVNEEFRKFKEMEDQYTLYAHQLDQIVRAIMFDKKHAQDSLPKFRKFLGNPDGYKSYAYKVFLDYLVRAFMYDIGAAYTDYFDTSVVILTGWDLYCFRAMEADKALSDYPPFFDGKTYFRFAELYPGTQYQRLLYEKYLKMNKNGQIGTIMPIFNLIDVSGKAHSTQNFKGKYWCMVVIGDNADMTNQIFSEVESYVKKHNDQVLFCIWAKKDADRELIKTRLSGKNFMLLAGSEKNPELSKFLAGLSDDIMVIDPSGRIVSYGMFELPNLVSWPVSKISTEKTINLKVLWYSLGGAFFLSIMIISIIRIRSKRNEARLNLKRKIAQLEVDAVRSRMNPHFLFNALGSIQNLVNRGNNKEASLYLARFGDLVRTILTQSSKPVIGLNEEIDMIRNYLQLEQLGFPFTFDIQVDPALDPATIEVPPLLVQPHVENAVIHGISSLGSAGKITVAFRVDDQHLVCEVMDNGPGYHPGSRPDNEGLGQGWKLTRQRIQLMKEQYGEEVSVEVSDAVHNINGVAGNPGTKVTFRLPLQKFPV